MPWLRLTIETKACQVEPLSELLEQFNAASISYNPASDDEALYGESPENEQKLWHRTLVTALLDCDTDIDILLACVRNRVGIENILAHKIETLVDKEWTETYKEGYKPMVFGDRLCVCPSWLQIDRKYPFTVMLDPGLAFGTGTHATTRLCLNWLSHQQLDKKVVIDYGCGSGILSLAAARLGAARVYAVDIDPQAVRATESNALKNKLDGNIRVMLPDGDDLPAADILIANILLNPLINLVPEFKSLIRPGGEIVLSGILAVQIEECLAAYGRWFNMTEPVFRDEWALLHGTISNH